MSNKSTASSKLTNKKPKIPKRISEKDHSTENTSVASKSSAKPVKESKIPRDGANRELKSQTAQNKGTSTQSGPTTKSEGKPLKGTSGSSKRIITPDDVSIDTSGTPNPPRKAPTRTKKATQVWLDLKAVPFSLGRVCIELFPDCPLAFENFRSLCTGEITDPSTGQKMSYAGSLIDEIHDDYVIGGEITDNIDEVDPTDMIESDTEGDSLSQDDDDDDDMDNHANDSMKKQRKQTPEAASPADGEQAVSIYGGYFKNEEPGLSRRHQKVGTVSMFSEKFNRNGSKFLITLKPNMKWLDGQYVVIGRVVKGMKALFNLQEYKDTTCLVENCGRVKKTGQAKVNPLLSEALEELKQSPAPTTPADDDDSPGASGESQKVTCPLCNTTSKYVKRVIGTGVRYRCRNQECKNAFWVSDTKVTEAVAQRVLELKKQQQSEEQMDKLEFERLELEYEQAQAHKKAGKKQARDEEEHAPATSALVQAGKVDVSKLPPAALAGPHQIPRILQSMSSVQEQRAAAAQRYIKSLQDHKEFVRNKRKERGEEVSDSEDMDDDEDPSSNEEIDYAQAVPVLRKPSGEKFDKKNRHHPPSKQFSGEPFKRPFRSDSRVGARSKPSHGSTFPSRSEPSNMNKKRPRHEFRTGAPADGSSSHHESRGSNLSGNASMVKRPRHTAPQNGRRPPSTGSDRLPPKKDKTRWRDRDEKTVPDWFREKKDLRSSRSQSQ